MVIEYIGTIIRSEVANRKERLYESQVTPLKVLHFLFLRQVTNCCPRSLVQNRGVYMFRIDNDYVIDATITGGPAR